jgi:hypothetical protein
MAKSNITSPTVLAHKRYARWTEKEILQALNELDVHLEEPFTGSILDKHLVTFSNGVTKQTSLSEIFRGVSGGKRVYRHTEESINEKLSELGLSLAEEYKGDTDIEHLIKFPDGHIKGYILKSVLSGKVNGKRHTTCSVNKRLAKIGAVLLEEFKGDISKKHLVRFSNGKVKNVLIHSVFNGNTTGKMDSIGRYTTEIANEKLKKYGAVLAEEFKGSLMRKHKIFFKCGHVHEIALDNVFSQGSGCPICAKGGFNPYAPAQLYFIELAFQGRNIYKLGVTNRTVEKRYSVETNIDYKILSLFGSQTGYVVHQAEQHILREFANLRYTGDSPFRLTGTKELFSCDIRYYSQFMEIIDEYGLEEALIAN